MSWKKRRSAADNLKLAQKIAQRAARFELRTLWAGQALDNNRIGIALWGIANRLAKRGGLEDASSLANYSQTEELVQHG